MPYLTEKDRRESLISAILTHVQIKENIPNVKIGLESETIDSLEKTLERLLKEASKRGTTAQQQLQQTTIERDRALVFMLLGKMGLCSQPTSLANANQKLVDRHLPGAKLTLANFRRLYDSNTVFRTSLILDNGVKDLFAEARQQEQSEQADQEQLRREFSAFAKNASLHGMDIADNEGNYSLFVQGARSGFAPNPPDKLSEMNQEARVQLLNSIEDRLNTSLKPGALVYDNYGFLVRRAILDGADSFASLQHRVYIVNRLAPLPTGESVSRSAHVNLSWRQMFSSSASNKELEERAQVAETNRDLRSMSPEQVRQTLRQQQAPAPAKVSLPADFSKKKFMQMEPQEQRRLIRQVGADTITSAINAERK